MPYSILKRIKAQSIVSLTGEDKGSCPHMIQSLIKGLAAYAKKQHRVHKQKVTLICNLSWKNSLCVGRMYRA